jgi:acylphosphatase
MCREIVQGVGFRPFVFDLVKRLGLRGFVLNSISGVDIELEGAHTAIPQFLEILRNDARPLSIPLSSTRRMLPSSRKWIWPLPRNSTARVPSTIFNRFGQKCAPFAFPQKPEKAWQNFLGSLAVCERPQR